jgi:phenylacetic acid degradation operon negative regulatory protein
VSLTAIVNEGAPVGSGRPRALIVTIYGLYARESGGWVSVSSLIMLMRELGVEEPAVRSSISRLKRRGILVAERQQGQAGYALSERAREILEEGDRRIFERPRATLEDGWVVAVFSVPESERRQRHMLRSRLAWLGFGTVSAGVWIAPRHLEDETRDVLERYELSPYVDLFSGSYLGFADLAAEVAQWWDLDSLQELYESFHATYTPVLRRWKRRNGVDGAEAFADYVRALTAWRHLPFLDPGLPPELLPKRWKGASAADLFAELRDRLEAPAHDYARNVVG